MNSIDWSKALDDHRRQSAVAAMLQEQSSYMTGLGNVQPSLNTAAISALVQRSQTGLGGLANSALNPGVPLSAPLPTVTPLSHYTLNVDRARILANVLATAQNPSQPLHNEPSMGQILSLLSAQNGPANPVSSPLAAAAALPAYRNTTPPIPSLPPQRASKKQRLSGPRKVDPSSSSKKGSGVLKVSLTYYEKKATFPLPSVKESKKVKAPTLETFKKSWELIEKNSKIKDPEAKKAFMTEFFSRKLAKYDDNDRLYRKVHGLPASSLAFGVNHNLPKKRKFAKAK